MSLGFFYFILLANIVKTGLDSFLSFVSYLIPVFGAVMIFEEIS